MLRRTGALLAAAALLSLTGCAVTPPPGVVIQAAAQEPGTVSASAPTITTATPTPTLTPTPTPTVTPSADGKVLVEFEVEAPKGTVAHFTDGEDIYSNRQDNEGIVAWQVQVPEHYVVALFISPSKDPTRCSIKINGQKVSETKVKGNYQAPTICDAVSLLPKVKPADIDPQTGEKHPYLTLSVTSDFGWAAWSSSVTSGQDFTENGDPFTRYIAGRKGDRVYVVVEAVIDEPTTCSISASHGRILSSAKADKQHPLAVCTATVPKEG